MSKALVVDDSRTIRTIIRRILLEMGYEVCEASNGKEALDVLRAEEPAVELILADWNMPVMDGFELLQNLRQDDEFSSVKVLMVTTETEIGHMKSAMDAGANEYVMKPFTKDILLEKLEIIGIDAPARG